MKIRWSNIWGTTEFESTSYEPTYISWPQPTAPDPRDLREERNRYRDALEEIAARRPTSGPAKRLVKIAKGALGG